MEEQMNQVSHDYPNESIVRQQIPEKKINSSLTKEQEEKLDYVFNVLKRQERRYYMSTISKWGFRIIIIVSMYLFYSNMQGILSKYIIPEVTKSVTAWLSSTWAWLSSISDSVIEKLWISSKDADSIKSAIQKRRNIKNNQ